MNRNRTSLGLAAAFAIMATCRIMLIFFGRLEAGLVADDTYYYFTIAKNLAAGNGPTFDGLAPTNGFHPLWQLYMVPFFINAGDLWSPVRTILASTIILDGISGLLVHRIVGRFAGGGYALTAAALWWLTPFGFFLGMQGMEASLSTLLVLGALERGCAANASLRSAAGVGVVLGLGGLARTDNLLSVSLAMAVLVFATKSLWPSIESRLRWLGVAAALALAVMAPWFIWSWRQFGSVVQVSARVKLYSEDVYGALHTSWGSVSESTETIVFALFPAAATAVRALTGDEFREPTWSILITAVILLSAVPLLIWSLRRTLAKRTELRAPILFVLTYMLLHTALFGLIGRTYATWYALPFFGLTTVLVGWLAPAWRRATGTGLIFVRAGVVLWLAALLAIYPLYALRFPHGDQRPDDRFAPHFERVQELLPAGAVVGAWDAGVAGYVATDYETITVTNLDCLVNNVAFEAVRGGRYRQYLLQTVDLYLQDQARARMFLDAREVQLLKDGDAGP